MRSWKALNPWGSIRGLPAEVWVLFAVTLVNRAGTMVLPFLALYVTEDLGYPAAFAGALFVVYGVGAMIAAPLSGRIADRFGARRVMQMSLATSGAILLALPAARGVVSLSVAIFVWSVTAEALRPASMAIVGELVPPEQRKPAFTLVRLAVNLGMSVGPAFGGFLAMSSFHLLFFVDGATSLAACAVLALAPWRPRGEAPTRAAVPGAPAVGAAHLDRRFLAFLAGVVIVSSVFFQTQAAMPLFIVRELGFSEGVYGLLFAVNTLLIVAFEVPLSSATAEWPHRVALAAGSLLYAIGFGALGVVEGLWSVAGTIVIWTFGEMLLMPAMSAYATEIAPPERRGEYMGLYTMAFSLSFTVAPGLGTEVLARFGSPTLWACCFATGIVGAAIFWRLRVRS